MAGEITLARDVVVVRGPDTRSFLQSLVSQDLDPLAPGDGAHSLLLAPQGKLVADFRLLVVDAEEIWCDCEAGVGDALRGALQRFKIRVKAELELVTTSLLVVRGDDSDDTLRAAGAPVPAATAHAHVEWGAVGGRVIRAAWPTQDGLDVLAPFGDLDAATRALGASVASLDYETARIEAGIVLQGVDIDETTIAQEAELELDAVSFSKGCFVGQELVCRIDSRGHVNRFVRRLELTDGAPPPPPGTPVEHEGRDVGRITSAAPAAPLALATVRREVEIDSPVEVAGRSAIVKELKPEGR
jgi:folate-binding protein YgfZ